MNAIQTITLCGGGSLGHVCAGYLASRGEVNVNIFTTKPEKWSRELLIDTPDGTTLTGRLGLVSSNPQAVIPQSQVVLLCLPGFAIHDELEKIAPMLTPGTYVGSVFCSTGFFFEALDLLPDNVALWGFQRVPFISRTTEYGHRATLKGYKNSHRIAIERSGEEDVFAEQISRLFGAPVEILENYYEASYSNSNPILHPARIYSLLENWKEGDTFDHNILFYEEWTDRASELLIAMDRELFEVLDRLPVTPGYLTPILEYYESVDASSLTRKIRSIGGFKGIGSPMVETAVGWVPDFKSRYFVEDFPYGLRFIKEEADRQGVSTPVVNEIYAWGMAMLKQYNS